MLPIMNSMQNRNHFLGCPGVLCLAMVLVVSAFILVGLFGFLKYGEDTKPNITLNLPDRVQVPKINTSKSKDFYIN